MPVAVARRIRGVVPFRVPSTYTEALAGTLSRIRTPVACGITVVLTTTLGLMITDGGVVVSAGLKDWALIHGSGTLDAGPDISPAWTRTGNKKRMTGMMIKRPECSFMYSPDECRELVGFPGYMPCTSRRFKRIDVNFY